MSEENKSEMSFLDHLEVLRWHLVRSAIVVGVAAISAYIFSRWLFDHIILAPKNPDFITYKWLCKLSYLTMGNDALCIKEVPFTLINIDMSGQLTTDIKVSFFSGLIIAVPYICWEFWRFISPALREKERKSATGFVFYISALFLIGILFGYYIILPLSVNFLGTYQVSTQVINQISLESFISLVTTLTLASGVIFELPVLVYILSRLGFITPAFMRKYRRHAIVATLVIAAVITPPDVTSQVLVTIPILILYEISIFISAAVLRKKV